MKKSINLITLLGILTANIAYSQQLNWNALGESKHIVHASIGWEYGFLYNVGYAHQFKSQKPLLLNINFSMPSGGILLDDFKIKMGGQLLVFNRENFKGTLAINGIFRRYENPLVRLVNFGTEIRGVFGYYKSHYFVTGEFGFDKAIVTHFKHTEKFKENVYTGVTDGWYEPATGGNFNYGIHTGYAFNKHDVTLSFGKIIAQDFKTSPLIPYYLMLGINYRLD